MCFENECTKKPPRKKNIVFSTIRLHAVALLIAVEGRGHGCRKKGKS